MNHLLSQGNVTEHVLQMRTYFKKSGCMIILIGWNVQSTLCSNAVKHVKLNSHCHYSKPIFAKVYRKLLSYYNQTVAVNIKQF